MDPISDPNHESQYSAWDEVSKEYVNNAAFMKQLGNTTAIYDVALET